MTQQNEAAQYELARLLDGGNAHATLKDALKALPVEARGKVATNLPYSIWQIVEHIRIAQWDMLEFTRDGEHESPEWPAGYWPKDPEPPSEAAWKKSVKQIESDTKEFKKLISDGNVFASIRKDGPTIMREALLIADHNAYHIAEIVVIRRVLGCWK